MKYKTKQTSPLVEVGSSSLSRTARRTEVASGEARARKIAVTVTLAPGDCYCNRHSVTRMSRRCDVLRLVSDRHRRGSFMLS